MDEQYAQVTKAFARTNPEFYAFALEGAKEHCGDGEDAEALRCRYIVQSLESRFSFLRREIYDAVLTEGGKGESS